MTITRYGTPVGGSGGSGDIESVTAGTGLTGGGLSGAVSLAADFGSASGKVTEGNDSRLSNARTPTAHAASHQPGGSDAMAVGAAAGVGSLRTIGTGALEACAGNDSRLSDSRAPTAHATTHQPGGSDAMAVGAAAGVGSLRTIGTGALEACAGNDSRLSDSRVPTAHATTHQPGGSDAMAVGAAAGVGSLRTIGTGALEACAGNDSRLSDSRAPTAHATTHQPGGSDAMAVGAAAGVGSLRTIGTGALEACAGNDSRLSDIRTPTAHSTTHAAAGSDRQAGPLGLDLGSVSAPAYSFTGDLNTGMYSSGADVLDFTTGGTNRLSLASTGATFTVPILGPAGTIGAPTHSFSGDSDSGFYNQAANAVSLSLAGAEAVRWTTGQIMSVGLGTAAAPAWAFTGDPNTGVFSSGADALDISTGGTTRLTVSTTLITPTLQIAAPQGTVGAPSYSFAGDSNCGICSTAADTIDLVTAGTSRLQINGGTSIIGTTPYRGSAGTVSAPSLSFNGDSNTGIYNVSADILGLTVGGVEKFRVATAGIGFFATAAAGQVTVTGSRTTTAALSSLLTGLATYGLIIDSSTA